MLNKDYIYATICRVEESACVIKKNHLRNGFTLIELLAVIVILAIIAVIATPIIVEIIEDTKKSAFERSVERIIRATDINVVSKQYDENYVYELTDGVLSDGVQVSNTTGLNGKINYDLEGKVEYAIHNGKFCVKKSFDMSKSEIIEYVEEDCILIIPTSKKCFAITDGVINKFYTYENNDETQKKCPEDVIIPNGIVAIADGAFTGTAVTSVNIPGSVKTIGSGAFSSTKLSKLTLNDGLEVIGSGAFAGTAVTSVDIPVSVKTIENGAFSSTKLSELKLNDGLEVIGTGAFANTALKKVVIPSTVHSIALEAFYTNSGILTIINKTGKAFPWYGQSFVEGRTGPINVIAETDEDCFKIENNIIKDYYEYENNDSSQPACSRDVHIPITVYGIDSYAFAHKNLKSVEIPYHITNIPDSAFYDNKLTKVILPSRLETIGTSAFAENELTDIAIPNKVTIISPSAFAYNKLENIGLPANLEKISPFAFAYNNLTSLAIPFSVTEIGSYAFSQNQLSEVIIPSSVEIVEEYAFYDNPITDILIGNDVGSIGANAFVSSKTIKNVLNSTGKEYNWASIVGHELSSELVEPAPESCFEIEDEGIKKYYKYENNDSTQPACPTNIIIPSIIKGENILYIGTYSFYDDDINISNVVFPDSVIIICDNSFPSIGLQNLLLGKNLERIDENAFVANPNVKSISIPNSVTTIGASAFNFAYNSGGIQSVALGNSVNEIMNYSFLSQTGIRNIVIPDSVTTISGDAFQNSGRGTLATTIIGENVRSIGKNAFLHPSSTIRTATIVNTTDLSFDWDYITLGTTGSSLYSEGFNVANTVEILQYR